MTSQDIERRIKRTENNITAVYEMLGDLRSVQDQHSAALIRIEARLAGHDARFDTIEGRFDTINGRIDTIEGRFDAMDTQFEAVASGVSEILRRLPEAG